MDNINISVEAMSLSLSPSDAYEPTSTLQYLNAQLIAHGYACTPGISLEGLSVADNERVVKCVLGMLNQRMEDMKRTEELSSKYRTLTYEYERLQSMHRTALNNAANAERDMTMFKAKANTIQKTLAAEVAAHKQTSTELQRTRTSLQYLRSTTQNELKRKDKEIERILERWNKVADSQVKLSAIGSGLRCGNVASEIELSSKGKSIMEEALGQAEEAREELMKENEGFRSVILGTANALQGVIFDVTSRTLNEPLNEPSPLTHTAIFAPPTSFLLHPENAHLKLRELLASLREAVAAIQPAKLRPVTNTDAQLQSQEEIAKLKELVDSLKAQISNSQKASASADKKVQKVYDRFTGQLSKHVRECPDTSVTDRNTDLIFHSEYNEIRRALEERAKQLQIEQAKFTEATVKLGKEKKELELERVELVEEKRRWTTEKMLAELPSTPGLDPDIVTSPKALKAKVKQSSPRIKSPKKISVTSRSPPKKGVTRRISLGRAETDGKKLKLRSTDETKETIEVLYDPRSQVPLTTISDAPRGVMQTDSLQRSTTPEDSPSQSQEKSIVNQESVVKVSKPLPPMAAGKEGKASQSLVLPTAFMLPPPSPASSLPLKPLPIPVSSSHSQLSTETSSSKDEFDRIPLAPHTRIFPSPRTPNPIPPILKKHAYSPARPSPLSRILMIADSPPSPLSKVSAILEEEEVEKGDPEHRTIKTTLSAVDELNPLRELSASNFNGKMAGQNKERRLTVKEKGKGHLVPAVVEKENSVVVGKRKAGGSVRAGTGTKATDMVISSSSSVKPAQKGSSVAKVGGARRIPIGSTGAGKLGGRM